MDGLTRGLVFAALALAALATAGRVEAAPDCNASGELWSSTTPAVNERHIFCGEIAGSKVKGYHSKVVLPSDVVTGVGTATSLGNGIYNATVTFSNSKTKLSTFFPDACTADQIVASAVYAAGHSTGSASPWGYYGPSAPSSSPGTTYCLNSASAAFQIRYALDTDSDVNTAFPSP